MTPFDTLVAFSGAEPDVARTPGDPTLVGRCPVCDHAKSFLLIPHEDGTASAFCVMNGGKCSPDAILDRCSIPRDALLSTADGSFAVAHDLPLSPSRSVLGVAVLDRAALATLPEPEPLIADTLDRRTVALLAGPPGAGKSFVALDWAASVATGSPWLGRTVEPGRVLYVVGEGAYGVHARLSAWEEHHGAAIPLDALLVLPTAVQVSRPDDLDALVRYVERESFDLVILDTLARMSVGVDENSAQGMGVLVDAVERLKRATVSGSILVVHHTGKDGETVRGSSALEGAMDTVYRIEAHFEPHTLTRTKRKDGPVEDEVRFVLEPVADSCVFAPTDPAKYEIPEDAVAWHSGWRAVRLAYFGKATFSKAEAVTAMKAQGIARPTAYRWFTYLIDAGLVKSVGPESAQRWQTDDRVARKLRLPIPDPFTLRAQVTKSPDLAEGVSPASHEARS